MLLLTTFNMDVGGRVRKAGTHTTRDRPGASGGSGGRILGCALERSRVRFRGAPPSAGTTGDQRFLGVRTGHDPCLLVKEKVRSPQLYFLT